MSKAIERLNDRLEHNRHSTDDNRIAHDGPSE